MAAKSVLLYSGGLDSELYRLLINPDILLFFDNNVRYSKHEVNQLRRFENSGLFKGQKLVRENVFDFSSIEKPNAIVPMRNIFFFLRAIEHGAHLYIGVTYYDLHYDKQPDTLAATEQFIRMYYYKRDEPEAWQGAIPSILTPYAHLTKGQLLKRYLDTLNVSETEDAIRHFQKLRTCYDAESVKGCGVCKSCVQKAIALAVNNCFNPKLFDTDPRFNHKKWSKAYLNEAKGNIDVSVFKRELNILLHA